ncbi:MAG: sulfatase-like hydrolase/transferase [Cyclobacteriaceae bacterium]
MAPIHQISKLFLFFYLITLAACAQENRDRPNILVILCDDLGYSDVGFNGSKDIPTPALDRLALGGTICTSGYVAHPFCGPSRAALMTGRYPHKYGSQFNLPVNNSGPQSKGIALSETFISKLLQDAGYYTGAVGKWHLGEKKQFHPNNRGFDDFYGFLGGGHRYFPSEYKPVYEKQLAAGNTIINDYLKPLEHNMRDVDETEYITDALSREAVRFINDAPKKDQPFFLYLAYNAPHSPLEARDEDLQHFAHIKEEKRRTYAAMVYAVDRGVAKITEALTANDQLDNTLIVFLSDNGGKLSLGATNFPLKEGKGSTCEGGYRVPMFFHWPDVVPAGKRYHSPISALDFFPTFAHLAQAKIPASKELDGKNIWYDFINGRNARSGEMVYAMRHREGYSDVGARKDEWKILKTGQQPWRLFNIEKDKGESFDLSEQYPERLREMVQETQQWSTSHSEPRWFNPQELEQLWTEKEMADFGKTFLAE